MPDRDRSTGTSSFRCARCSALVLTTASTSSRVGALCPQCAVEVRRSNPAPAHAS